MAEELPWFLTREGSPPQSSSPVGKNPFCERRAKPDVLQEAHPHLQGVRGT